MHFSTLKQSCQVSAQSTRLFRSAKSSNLSSLLCYLHISCTYYLREVQYFTNTTNRTRPRALPCETPLLTSVRMDVIPLTHTLCLLPMGKSLIQSNTLPLTLWAVSLLSNLLCGTESRAFTQSAAKSSSDKAKLTMIKVHSYPHVPSPCPLSLIP